MGKLEKSEKRRCTRNERKTWTSSSRYVASLCYGQAAKLVRVRLLLGDAEVSV